MASYLRDDEWVIQADQLIVLVTVLGPIAAFVIVLLAVGRE